MKPTKAKGSGRSSLWVCLAALAGCVACSSTAPSASGDLASAVSGAASPQGDSADTQDADTTDAPLPESEYVFLSKSPTNVGYAVDELNTATRTRTVSALDLSHAGCDLGSIDSALETPETVAANGVIRGDTFVASAVYRALPDLAPAVNDGFFQATSVRGGDAATSLNVGVRTEIARVDLSSLDVPFIDRTWLSARLLQAGALAAGSLDSAGASLVVSTIYLPVPDDTKCPEPVATCGAGTIATYARDPSRCLTFTACVRPGMCPQYIPVCDPGYELARWPASTGGCAASACDPSFDPAPATIVDGASMN